MDAFKEEKRMSFLNLNGENNMQVSSAESIKTNSEVSFNDSDKDPSEKEILKTIDDMKKERNNFLKGYKNSYDLDEEINAQYIRKILDSQDISNQIKINTFNDIQYKLSYSDRTSILSQYKDLFSTDELNTKNKEKNLVIIRQNDKLKNIFISLLKDIIEKDSSVVKKLFQTKYYIKEQSSKFPFLYGSEEYIFANLIYDTYDTFIKKSTLPKKAKDRAFDEYKHLSNYVNSKAIKPLIKPVEVSETKDINNSMEIEEEIPKEIEIKNYLIKNKYIDKVNLLEPIFEIYCSDEFQKKYDELLGTSLDKRVKYIYEIILESLYYYCLNFDEVKKKKIILDFAKTFYEYENIKIKILERYSYDFIKIKDSEGEDLDFSKGIKNKIYKVTIGDFDFDLNFYDYKIQFLFSELVNIINVDHKNKKQYLENILNDSEYWTIQKYAIANCLYREDTNLNKLFKEEINIMLKHKVLENVFDEVPFFQNYQYPFLNEKFLEQVHNSIVYIKLPTKLIIGLTIKNMGVIVINRGRYDELINEQKNKNVKFALKLSEFSFYKITLIHEINFHYFLVIFYYNGKIKCLYTPETVFKNYIIDKKEACDFGDKGEVILFGKKVTELYINGIVNIISLKLWNENINSTPREIGIKFLDSNKDLKGSGKLNIKELITLSKFTGELFNQIKNEIDLEPFTLEADIGDFFSRGKILNKNIVEFNIKEKDFATIFPRGVCLNSYRY